MKKILLLLPIFLMCIALAISSLVQKNDSGISGLLFSNIEAMSQNEIPDIVTINCPCYDGSVCIYDNYVVIDSYYSPH